MKIRYCMIGDAMSRSTDKGRSGREDHVTVRGGTFDADENPEGMNAGIHVEALPTHRIALAEAGCAEMGGLGGVGERPGPIKGGVGCFLEENGGNLKADRLIWCLRDVGWIVHRLTTGRFKMRQGAKPIENDAVAEGCMVACL